MASFPLDMWGVANCHRQNIVSLERTYAALKTDLRPHRHSNVKYITCTSIPFGKYCVKLRLSSYYRWIHGSLILVGFTPISEVLCCKKKSKRRDIMVDCLLSPDNAEEVDGDGKGLPAHTILQPPSPWNLLERAKRALNKKPSMEDELRRRIEQTKSESGGGGGDDGSHSPPWGRDDDSEEPEDEEECSWDERLQVFLATTGLLFVYIYIIKGQEITLTAKDCLVRYIFGGPKTSRVARVEFIWEVIVRNIKGDTEDEEDDPQALTRLIINTPTWWDHPDKYKGLLDDDRTPPPLHSDSDPESDSDSDDSLPS